MHLHRDSTILSVIKMLLIILISVTYTSASSPGLTPEELAQVLHEVGPERYCGRKLTEAMRHYCNPMMRTIIQSRAKPVKKSLDSATEFDFESFDVDRMGSESYDDDLRANVQYKVDENYVNDVPFMFPSQGRRRRRGIIDECCKKSCRKIDLIAFCPNKQYS